MTALELIRQCYIDLGEPSDRQYFVNDKATPDTDPVANTEYFQNWCQWVDLLNQACLAISAWKFPDGRQLRFRAMEDTATFQARFWTIRVVQVTGNIIQWVSLDPTRPVNGIMNTYKGFALVQTSTNQTVQVMRSWSDAAGNAFFMLSDAGTIVAGDDFTLYKREYRFENIDFQNPPIDPIDIPHDYRLGRPLEIIDVVDSITGADLDYELKYDHVLGQTPVVGIPGSFYKLGLGVRFDTWPSEARAYFVRFMRGPRVVGYFDPAEEPELPPQFHEALGLWMLWRGLRAYQENSSAYSTKKDLEDMLRRTRTEEDLQDTLAEGQMKLHPNGR